MKFSDRLRMSIQSLFKRRLRTVLTILGVVIGIAAIVIMMALGEGMNQASMEMIEQYGGIRTVNVREGNDSSDSSGTKAGKDPLALKLTDETVEMIRNMEHAEIVSPVLSFQAILKTGMYENDLWGAQGMSLEAMRDKKWEFAEGDFPKEGEPLQFIYGNQVLLDFRNSKTGKGYYDTGEMPDIDLMKSPVFAIFDTDAYYQSKNQSSDSFQGQAESGDGSSQTAPPKKYRVPAAGLLTGGENDYYEYSWNVYCDIEALIAQLKKVYKNRPIPGQPLKSNGSPYNKIFYSSIYVRVDEIENVQALQQTLTDMGYQADSDIEWISQMQEQSRAQQAMLGGIGAVALLVAAIGIANTMMMSIYERTKEIGIMKVLGCDLRDIQSLFLIEAAFIGFTGGVLGIGLSYGVCAIINAVTKASTAIIPLWLVPAALLFAVLVGMAAGFMPSRRAMRLSPLAAIRNE